MTGWSNPQLVDPIGSAAARTIAAAASIAAFVIAVIMGTLTADEVRLPVVEVAAFTALAAAGVVFVRGASPFRFPFSRTSHVAMLSLLVGAAVLDAIARWGSNLYARDDWLPVCMAVIVLFTGVYRPAWEILSFTITSCVMIALIVGLQSLAGGYDGIGGTPLSFVIIAIAPIAASGIATAAVSRGLVVHFRRMRQLDAGDQRDAAAGLRSRIAPEVTARRRALLAAEVTPYLRGLAETGELTAADSDRARELASALRDTMLIDAESNWLGELIGSVDDPELLAEQMSTAQRAAIRAFLTELRATGLFDPATIRARLRAQDELVFAVVSAPFVRSTNRRTPRVGWYAAILRRFFPGARIDQTSTVLRLEFAYRPV